MAHKLGLDKAGHKTSEPLTNELPCQRPALPMRGPSVLIMDGDVIAQIGAVVRSQLRLKVTKLREYDDLNAPSCLQSLVTPREVLL